MRTVCPSSNAPCLSSQIPPNQRLLLQQASVTLGYANIKIGFLRHHFAHLDKYKMCHGGTSVFCCWYFASKRRASLENADVLTFLHYRHHHKLVKGSNTQNHSCASKVTHIHKRICSQKHKTVKTL